MTPTVTVCDESERISDRHDPIAGEDLAGIAELHLGQRVVGLFGQFDERAVGQRIAADDPRVVLLAVVLAVERDANSRRAFDDVVVRQDEAGLVDDEAGAGRLHHLLARLLLAAVAARLPRLRLAEEALEEVVTAAAAAPRRSRSGPGRADATRS